MLFDKLDMDDEKDAQEKAWAEQQMAEYQAVGVTIDGKNYYYQGKLVNIFLDIRANNAFYALDMNPSGTVNIKIIRDANDKITGVACMTEAEVTELLEDMDDPDDDDWDALEEFWDDREAISIPVSISEVKDGEYIWLGIYTLAEGDLVFYNVSAESGKRLDVGFAKPGQAKPDTRYNMVSYRGTDGEPEVKTGAMTWETPIKSGEYSLFIHAEGGSLTDVTGYVTIIKVAAD